MTTIKSIKASPPGTNRTYEIELNGKNLIIVGGNGSGKTSFLMEIWGRIKKQIVDGGSREFNSVTKSLANLWTLVGSSSTNNDSKSSFKKQIASYEQWLKEYGSWSSIQYDDEDEFLNQQKGLIVLRYFEAYRQSKIEAAQTATGVKVNPDKISIQNNLGTSLEQHLLNLRVRSALGFEDASDEELERRNDIKSWFGDFEKNIGYLFEDESTRLEFDKDELKFYLKQDDKPRFTFQNLSSGYSSILDIYADLLIRTEYFSITADKLQGIVVIDELDAHLHVSLQRRIFPFFVKSFPNIQFIISTHSPFVLTSVNDAIIYDITTMTALTDLSMYSFESVIEGLLGVPPVSKELEDRIKELAAICESESFDAVRAEQLISHIEPAVDHLDEESRMFYGMAVNKLLMYKKNSNV